jgi:hypothetical protein
MPSMMERRNAEIVAKRKAGRTLRSLGVEYGLHAETIRRIEIEVERHDRFTNPPPRRDGRPRPG